MGKAIGILALKLAEAALVAFVGGWASVKGREYAESINTRVLIE